MRDQRLRYRNLEFWKYSGHVSIPLVTLISECDSIFCNSGDSTLLRQSHNIEVRKLAVASPPGRLTFVECSDAT